jgi:hypothetical protein
MKALTVSYTMTAQSSDITQYLLTPFGYAGEDVAPDDASQAQLYVGLAGAAPGDTLSLYWQLESPQALAPFWQYLNQGNQWLSLDDTVADGTEGLLASGVWSAILPDDAADDAARMPTGRYWLRATMPPQLPTDGDVSGYPWLSGITANSMTATLDAPQTLDSGHFLRPLPAGTITRAVAPIAGVETVMQPWPSTGGQPAEIPPQFLGRMAQRLSHRERALTWQDMASLLKTRYANVFDVAIPPVDVMTRLPSAATQTLLMIPVNAKKDNQDPLRPKFSQAHLHDMAEYLQSLASPWASIALINPSYRDVLIAYDVTFNVNPDYGYRKLKELLTSHYMPWAWDSQSGVALGNRLDYYGVIAWIQQQSFVERVNTLTLDGTAASVQGGEQEVLVLTWSGAALSHSERTKHE